jgi:3-deoxy-manno-octulosonate cytidylyltransferase (CMP-KDO synthetase)
VIETVAIIPARLASTRLPRKALRPIAGIPMLERVYRRAVACDGFSRVLVATEDEEIEAFCRARAIPVERTGAHPSGTDRLAEVARRIPAGRYVNVQGDEPLLDPRQVAALLSVFRLHPAAAVATVVAPVSLDRIADPATVKVALAADGRALYFSRAAIPFDRDLAGGPRWQHVGLYAYTPEALAAFTALGESPLERTERLEQLRFLEAGFAIYAGITDVVTRSVDTDEDLRAVEAILAGR